MSKIRNPKAEIPNKPAIENVQTVRLGVQDAKIVLIALGSNLGDSRHTVIRAMARLQEFSNRPVRKSSVWETEPVNCPPGSQAFSNAVVILVPQKDETPESLLGRLHAIEAEFGRTRSGVRNEPRPLDLDLIAFGGELRATRELTLPHPRAHERRFVLEPLAELIPDYILPGQRETVLGLLKKLPAEPKAKRIAL